MKKPRLLPADWINRLGKRERKAVLGGAVFLFLLLAWFLLLGPFLEKMDRYDRQSRQKEADLAEMGVLKEGYQPLKNRIDRMEQRVDRERKEFSFPAFLENRAIESKVKNKMTSLRPQGSQTFENLKSTEMEVKFEDVTLQQAVTFLSGIESSPSLLNIKSLHLKTRYSEPKNLDMTLVISHYERIR